MFPPLVTPSLGQRKVTFPLLLIVTGLASCESTVTAVLVSGERTDHTGAPIGVSFGKLDMFQYTGMVLSYPSKKKSQRSRGVEGQGSVNAGSESRERRYC